MRRIVRRWTLAFCDDDLLPVWRAAAVKAGLRVVRTGVWVREGGAPQFTGDRPAGGAEYVVILHRPVKMRWNGGGLPAVWAHPIVANRSGHRRDRVHTTQKPESLMSEIVSLFTEPGETVLDPFAGSGTTGVAALRYGRSFVGLERSAEYADVARGRCAAAAALETSLSLRMKQASLLDKIWLKATEVSPPAIGLGKPQKGALAQAAGVVRRGGR